MPTWVKVLLDDWLQAANLSSGKLFRRVNKNGKAWGEGMTEKAVWHVVREYAAKLALRSWPRTTFAERARGCAMRPEGSWNRFNFSSGTSRSRPQSDTSAVNNESAPR